MHRARRERARTSLDGVADGLLVMDSSDLRYLTGFSGSNGALFLSSAHADADVLSTDGRYVEQAAIECPDLGVLVARDCVTAVCEQALAQGGGSIALDDRASLAALAAAERTSITVVRVTSPVAALRMAKDSGEIAALERACAITSQAVDALAGGIRPGDTEIGIARRLEQLFGELGAEDRSFPTIVASGPNSAMPHHRPNSRAVIPGDLLVIDSGARVDGYHADMTRTFVVGEPEPWQRDLYALVAEAARAGRAAVRPGVALADLDAAARGVIEAAGHGGHFGHGLGHGTGLDIHEAPMIGPRAVGRLAAETTITVEPGVYIPGRGGVRIEDSLVVTADGHRSLTTSLRDLRVVG